MRRLTAVLTAATAAAVLAGCAPSSPEAIDAQALTDETKNDPKEPIGPGGEISIVAFDLGFRDLEGTPVDGAIKVTLDNVGDAFHNFRIDNAAGENVLVEAAGGETGEGELLLFGQPGGLAYTYYCDVPGHRSAGMEGTLFVYADAEEAATEPISPDAAMEEDGA